MGEALTGVTGLTIYAGMSETEQDASATNKDGDIEEQTIAVKYAMGGFTLGYQISEEDNGRATTTTGYDNDGFGIVFAVNDDLSISYIEKDNKQQSNGYGIGVKIKSFIGPIDFTWGRGYSEPFNKNSKKINIFYFNFGVVL